MSDSDPSVVARDEPASVAPSMHLSRRGLVLSLAAMVLAGVSVYSLFPETIGGPPLPVAVEIGQAPVPTPGGQGRLLAPVVRVRNQASHEIPRLTIELNGQYLLMQDSPLQNDEQLVLPQRVFTDKRSSQRFNPDKYEVEEVTVTGQLPSGARGMSKFEFRDGELVGRQ